MRKIITTSFVTLLVVVLVYSFAYALGGVCSNCHTMHNSQNGDGEVVTYDGSGNLLVNQDTPQPQLLKASCIACHTGSVAESTSAVNARFAPIVLRLSCPDGQGGTFTLAGGDFCYVASGLPNTGDPLASKDSKGHNVIGLAAPDGAIAPANTPPGFDSGATPGIIPLDEAIGTTWASNQLSCDGVYGCHGMHTASGVTGAHHNNPTVSATQVTTDPTTIGGSYRFLGGIRGLENVNWNWGEAIGTHNEYYGVNDTSNRNQSNSSYLNRNTISYSCAQCHGYFHSRIDNTTTGSPWLRHPTDIMLPAGTTEYASYNPNTGPGATRTYNLQAPVARPSFPVSNNSQVTPGSDAVVMCLSCHRAHGSPEKDLLRWYYDDMVAGNGGVALGTGCFVCHTTKD